MSGSTNLHELYPIIETLNIRIPHHNWETIVNIYFRELTEANKTVNLTRITSFEDYVIKHIVDSLFLVYACPEITDKTLSIADVGCGAGFPGVPLAFSYPNLRLTEIDSVGKKVTFTNAIIKTLSLTNCSSVKGRAMELSASRKFNNKFDIVIARAVSGASKLIAECNQLLKPTSGRLILYKTPNKINEELIEIKSDSTFRKLTITKSPIYELPAEMGKRQFLILSPN